MRPTLIRNARLLLLLPVFAISVIYSLGTGSSDVTGGMQSKLLNITGQSILPAPPVTPPAELATALSVEYGSYERLVTPQSFITDLQSRQIICVGEAHYEARDMQTAFELARLLAQRRPIALAVERLSRNMQPQLSSLTALASDDGRGIVLQSLFQMDDYQKVWGTKPKDRSGYPTNTPSLPVFEALVSWAAQNRVPVIGLDVSWSERGRGLGEDIAYRTALWSGELASFLAEQRAQNYLVVLVAGISHCTNAPDSVTSKLKNDGRFKGVVSIGQRDAMYQYLSSAHVARLAQTYNFPDVIVRHPQVAVVSSKGVAEFPAPPDYWIAVHSPDSW